MACIVKALNLTKHKYTHDYLSFLGLISAFPAPFVCLCVFLNALCRARCPAADSQLNLAAGYWLVHYFGHLFMAHLLTWILTISASVCFHVKHFDLQR